MNLKIPEHINYECTGCGKCCSGWAVPMTEEDYQRIAAIDWGALEPSLKGKNLFRALKTNEKINTPYTQAIIPTPEGQCPFLKNNLCFIHSQFGAAAKPAICQLFPYSFNETPDGVYTTVSFISRGAIFNAGRSLVEQREYLESKYKDFQKLFPDHHPNWSAIKLSSNIPLGWEKYLEIEQSLLGFIQNKNTSLENRFIEASNYLNTLLLANSGSQKNLIERQVLNNWDKVLLATLYKRYFPTGKEALKSYGQIELSLGNFVWERLFAGDFSAVLDKTLVFQASGNNDINDLIYRFFYSRLFARLYFGAGFGQLSVIAGFNHLAILLVLLKIKMRQLAMTRSSLTIAMEDTVVAIVQLEKSLGELKISPYGAAVLELLLTSQARIKRLLLFTGEMIVKDNPRSV